MALAAAEPLLLDGSFFDDPHARYAVLREQRPVVPAVTSNGLRVWLVTRYADVRAALNDARLGKDSARFSQVIDRQLVDPSKRVNFMDALNKHMLSSDPPDHTRLRKLVSRGFTVRGVAGLRPRIEAIAGELIESMAAALERGETVDLLDRFAFPLPMTVIAEILGVGDRDRESFRSWSNTVLSDAPIGERAAAGTAMGEYLAGLVEAKRAKPGPDMLSSIVAAAEDADQLSPAEAVSTAFLLLVAGHETTVNLIGNGMLALLRHPDRYAELRADPGLTAAAVEEFLRYDGPLNTATFRHTLEPVSLSGVRIPAGEIVLLSLSSANRDPGHHDRPDELDLHREPAQHVAFGHGIHHCLGAPLARLEGEIAFRALVGRFPDLVPAADPAELTWRSSTLIRGLDRLPVRLAARSHKV